MSYYGKMRSMRKVVSFCKLNNLSCIFVDNVAATPIIGGHSTSTRSGRFGHSMIDSVRY